jgi:hypothetical protein
MGRLRDLIAEERSEATRATRRVTDQAARRRAERIYRARRTDAAAMGGRNDEGREAFRRAGEAVTMGAPFGEAASLDPLTAPEETEAFARSSGGDMESFVTGTTTDSDGIESMVSGLGGSEQRVESMVFDDGGMSMDLGVGLDMGVDY